MTIFLSIKVMISIIFSKTRAVLFQHIKNWWCFNVCQSQQISSCPFTATYFFNRFISPIFTCEKIICFYNVSSCITSNDHSLQKVNMCHTFYIIVIYNQYINLLSFYATSHKKLCRRLLVSSTGYPHIPISQYATLPLPFLWVDSPQVCIIITAYTSSPYQLPVDTLHRTNPIARLIICYHVSVSKD